MIQVIFFDSGNTLVQFDFELFARELKVLGIDIVMPQFKAAHWEAQKNLGAWATTIASHAERCRKANRQWFETGGIPRDRIEEALELIFEHPEAHRFWSALPKETPMALQRLADKGFRLGVISNSEGKVAQIMKELRLAHFFETIVDSFLVGVDKPDPKIFHIGLDRLGVAPAEAMYVGDLYEVDVIGARRAGLTPVLYDPHNMYPEKSDCRKITSLMELGRVVS